jgi:hypothetical protein
MQRIHSQARLRERIEEAASQIGKRCDDVKNRRARGIIAIDVSKLLNSGDRFFRALTIAAFSSECENLISAFRLLHEADLRSEKERRVLGIHVYSRLPGQVLQPVGSHTYRQALFIILHAKKRKDSNLAVRFFQKIKPAAIGISPK